MYLLPLQSKHNYTWFFLLMLVEIEPSPLSQIQEGDIRDLF